MPKTDVKKCEIAYRGPSSRGVFRKYNLWMKWEGQTLSYKKNRWVKLDFRKLVSWKVAGATEVYSGHGPIAIEEMPKIILKTAGRRGTETREFAFLPKAFEPWLYWIIRAILLHSQAPVPPLESFSQLTAKHKTKIGTRARMKVFDQSHEVFIGVVQHLAEHGKTIKNTYKKKSFQTAFEIEGPEVYSKTRSGMRYKRPGRMIGDGGSATKIFTVEKLLKPILQKNKTSGYKIVRQTEPMAAKTACSPYFGEKDDMNLTPLEELIKEAQIMAALGEHPNIVSIIDAHVLTTEKATFRVFLFMELGDHTLDEYQKKSTEHKLTAKLVRKFIVGILAGISHMHKLRIYHMDMKDEQVIICKDNVPKIIDFGMSTGKPLYRNKLAMFNDLLDAPFGSMGYTAPEWCVGTKMNKIKQLVQRDTYAVGMTILRSILAPYLGWKVPTPPVMITGPGEMKYRDAWEKILLKKDVEAKLKRESLFEAAMMALVMINKNPDDRVTVTDALDFIEDHFSRTGSQTVPGKGSSRTVRQTRGGRARPPQRARRKKTWKCRNCNHTFPYRPMQCNCLLYSHPDGDPLFVEV